jgi:uncharacterized membrane protein
MRTRLYNISLWIAVIGMASWFGGTLYQMAVVVPMWSSALPDSVRDFFLGTRYNETIWNFFGPPFMAARVLPLLAAAALGWHLRSHRPWLLTAAAITVAMILFTLFYIYPINEVLFMQAGGGQSAEQIEKMVRKWIFADRARFVFGTIGFLALLRALSLPVKNSE